MPDAIAIWQEVGLADYRQSSCEHGHGPVVVDEGVNAETGGREERCLLYDTRFRCRTIACPPPCEQQDVTAGGKEQERAGDPEFCAVLKVFGMSDVRPPASACDGTGNSRCEPFCKVIVAAQTDTGYWILTDHRE